MEHTWSRNPSVTQLEHAIPGQALLTLATQGMPPEPKQPMPEYTQTADVSRSPVLKVSLFCKNQHHPDRSTGDRILVGYRQ